MEDYLDEDQPINNQKFVCLSLFIPGKEEEGDQHDSRCGIKVRGSYGTIEQAESRVKELKAIDKFHHIYIGEVGKWLPFDPKPEESGKEIYPDKELNELMKNYKENRVKCDEVHEERKQTLTSNVKQDDKQTNKKKKKKKKKQSQPTHEPLKLIDGAVSIDVDSDEKVEINNETTIATEPEEDIPTQSIDDVLESHLTSLTN